MLLLQEESCHNGAKGPKLRKANDSFSHFSQSSVSKTSHIYQLFPPMISPKFDSLFHWIYSVNVAHICKCMSASSPLMPRASRDGVHAPLPTR